MNPKEDYKFRSADEIKAAFDEADVDFTKPITVSCGSGVTASVTAFCLYLLGKEEVPVYDGSWAEWGNDANTPIGP